MSRGEKLILLIGGALFYIPGYFFLIKEIGKLDYSIFSVVFGSFCVGFGLLLHSAVVFERQWASIQRNYRLMCVAKYSLKIIGTFITLSLGMFWTYLSLTLQADSYEASDLKLIKGTVSKKPEFYKGSKSSTSLNIYLKECPNYCFEPQYNKFVHYNTNFEEETNIGDTIILGVLLKDYRKYISKTEPLSYFDKHGGSFGFFQVYYIESKSRVYYNPKVHNLMDKEENELSWIFLIVSLPMLIGWIAIWHKELVKILMKFNCHKTAALLTNLRSRKIL